MLKDNTTSVSHERVAAGVAYLDVGCSELALLCLHGIQGSKESYAPLLNSFLTQRARLIIPDIPGFGASQVPPEGTFDLERQAQRLVQFVDALGIKRIVVYGHSLGGMLGTLLLEKMPHQLIGLISSEGNLRLVDCGESRRVAAMSFGDFEATRYAELQKRGIRTSARCFYETARSVVGLAESEHLLQVLMSSPCPVLFIRGGASHFKTVPVGDRIRNVEIPNETHVTLSESRGSLEAISCFLTEVSG